MTSKIEMFRRPFYFLRHGETEDNVRGIISGSRDVELTVLGRKQAHAAARVLANKTITAIYSSPLRRARETAEPIAQALGLLVNIIPELHERRQGELEGKMRDNCSNSAIPCGVEDFADFASRVLRGLTQVKGRMPIIVAHGGVFRVLCQTLEIPYAEGLGANALPLHFVPIEPSLWRLDLTADSIEKPADDSLLG